MKPQLLVIALDAADWGLIRAWARRGLLPSLARISEHGSCFLLDNHPLYRNESPWVSLLTGCSPETTGYWSPLSFAGRGYRARVAGAYSFAPHRPFHALAPGRRVTVFDLPHCGRLFSDVDGVQILGWGAHSPMGGGQSRPRRLLAELRRRFGAHPALRMQNRGSWWDGARLERLHAALVEGVRRRGTILRTLLREHPADLSVLAFSELHIAGHHFWHLSDRGHPVFGRNEPPLPDFLLDVYRETDRELGRLLDGMPRGTDLLVFSPEGAAANCCDLNSMVFLPEFLYRWNFPGRSLAWGWQGEPAAPIAVPRFSDWVEAVWHDGFADLPPEWLPRPFHGAFRKLAGFPPLHFPFYALRRLGPLQWQPAAWYRPWWPRMKAFALPSYGDGCIRLNLRGREECGVVEPSEVEPLCRELRERLLRLRDPRSGGPLVEEVLLPRQVLPEAARDRLPDADLVVRWRQRPNDMAAEAESDGLGPAPFWKSGSHRPTGFVIACGEGVVRRAPGVRARVTDVAPTVLDLLGAPRPGFMDGQPLYRREG